MNTANARPIPSNVIPFPFFPKTALSTDEKIKKMMHDALDVRAAALKAGFYEMLSDECLWVSAKMEVYSERRVSADRVIGFLSDRIDRIQQMERNYHG